jgi:hypothetical protein
VFAAWRAGVAAHIHPFCSQRFNPQNAIVCEIRQYILKQPLIVDGRLKIFSSRRNKK